MGLLIIQARKSIFKSWYLIHNPSKFIYIISKSSIFGQIYIIKREIGKGGYFVAGVKKKGRDESKMKWLNWWNKNKEKYE